MKHSVNLPFQGGLLCTESSLDRLLNLFPEPSLNSKSKLLHCHVNLNDLTIATQSAEEILADKLLALPAASNASSSDWVNIRYRDFFDIWFLRHQLGAKFDPEMLQKKIDDYAVKNYEEAVANTAENIQAKMDRSGGYIDHVARYFPPAIFREISASCHLNTHVDTAIEQLREVQEMMFERSYAT